MAFPDGWDRLSPLTLRFIDAELERAYQHTDLAEGVRRVRTASLSAVVVWVLVGLIAPPTLAVDAARVWPISAFMIALLLLSVVLSRWATTQRRRDAIGLGQQLAACTATLVLVRSTGTFTTYAMPGVMLTAVFGFSLTRHPFVGSVVVGAAYCLLFLVFAQTASLGSQLGLQFFVVAATVVASCTGAYILERSQRTAFAQSRLVSALRERVDRLLHQYLSPEVASSLIADPERAALGGEEVEVTVLFADLHGYTAYAEGRSPAAVVADLNTAFGAVVPIVRSEGGTVIQLMGDAIMVIFNAPNPQPDHALRAARAALAMQRAVGELPGADSRPQFRVGLNSGPALVGNIGAAEIRNFSALGDTTNLAARLQTYATEGTVVIGASTYELIRDVAVVRPLGAPELKGKSQAVEVYELVGLRQQDQVDSI